MDQTKAFLREFYSLRQHNRLMKFIDHIMNVVYWWKHERKD